MSMKNGVVSMDDGTGASLAEGTPTYDDNEDNKLFLRRKVGLSSGVAFTIGVMIGSGIFISPKGVVDGCGSVALSLIVWALCGVVSMLGGMCYIELGCMIHESGSSYTYLDKAFGDVFAFLYSWISILLTRPSSLSIIALTCGEYLIAPLFGDGCGRGPDVIIKMVAIMVIMLITAVNCHSVKLASDVQIVFTVAKVLALAIIIVGGIVKLCQGYTEHLATGFEGTETNLGKIAMGFYSGMWSYEGWSALNGFMEEVEDPFKNLPRCIYIGIPLVTLLYVAVNVSYFTVMSTDDILESPAVAWTWAEEVIPKFAWIIPLSVALSTFGAANGTLFGHGRSTLVAARKRHMVKVMAMISVKHVTPSPSLVLSATLAIIMVIPSNIGTLIDYLSFVTWTVYFLVCLGVITMRFTRKDDPRPYKVPLLIPAFMCLLSVYLVIAPIVEQPSPGYLFAILVILAGLFLYFPFVVKDHTIPGLDHFTTAVQLLMEVAPPTQLMEFIPGIEPPDGNQLQSSSETTSQENVTDLAKDQLECESYSSQL